MNEYTKTITIIYDRSMKRNITITHKTKEEIIKLYTTLICKSCGRKSNVTYFEVIDSSYCNRCVPPSRNEENYEFMLTLK